MWRNVLELVSQLQCLAAGDLPLLRCVKDRNSSSTIYIPSLLSIGPHVPLQDTVEAYVVRILLPP